MADKVVGGKTLRIGDVDWVLVDEGIRPVVPTLFVENRVVNGVIYLSMAESVLDGTNPPEARVCSRLRLDTVTAQILRNLLNDSIDMAHKPAAPDQKAN